MSDDCAEAYMEEKDSEISALHTELAQARAEVASLRRENDRLRDYNAKRLAQLPEGMKNCTIIFKECEKGHGWLTATNWVQHGCPTCERDSLRTALKAKDEALEPFAKRADELDQPLSDCSPITIDHLRKAREARKAGAQ